MIPLLFVALLSVDEPKAEEGMIELPVRCDLYACVMSREIAQKMMEAHNFHVEEIARLKAELDKIRVIKGCGRLEVLPKPKS